MAKTKAINPEIVVRGTAENPYYMVLYFDVSDKKWHLGYGSKYLDTVYRWLDERFEIITKPGMLLVLLSKLKRRGDTDV